MMETWDDCAKREVKEEMDIEIVNLQFAHVTNDVMAEEQKHYVTIFMMGEFANPHATLVNMEPEKCEGWESYSWVELLEIKRKGSLWLFGPLGKMVEDKPIRVINFFGHQPCTERAISSLCLGETSQPSDDSCYAARFSFQS